MPQCKPPSWVGIKEASRLLAIDEETVRRWCVEGRVDARKIADARWVVRIDDEGLAARPAWVSVRAAATIVSCDVAVMLKMCEDGLVHARCIGGSIWKVRLDADGFPADPPASSEERAS